MSRQRKRFNAKFKSDLVIERISAATQCSNLIDQSTAPPGTLRPQSTS